MAKAWREDMQERLTEHMQNETDPNELAAMRSMMRMMRSSLAMAMQPPLPVRNVKGNKGARSKWGRRPGATVGSGAGQVRAGTAAPRSTAGGHSGGGH